MGYNLFNAGRLVPREIYKLVDDYIWEHTSKEKKKMSEEEMVEEIEKLEEQSLENKHGKKSS